MNQTKSITTLHKWTDVSLEEISLQDEYLVNALNLEVMYLLSFDSDRWLAGFRENAGLDKKGKVRYEGWENSLIAGHSFGHYISACGYAYQSQDISSEDKEELHKNLTYLVDELKKCQDNTKGKPGFLWCASIIDANNVEAQFDHVEIGRTNITTEAWVPWYTMHKILQGLIDVYQTTGYGPALQVATALGDWVAERVGEWSEATRLKTLATEYGGMNDCLYELYEVTKEEKYAIAAHKFDEEALFEKVLSEQEDALNNLHANTTIPKFIGAMKRYLYVDGKSVGGEVVQATQYLAYCKAFFNMVWEKHTYITGGNSEWEHFGADYVLDGERTNCNNETCNTYNMLKLAKLLFMHTGERKYADFYENTYINAILSSQNPKTGMTTYFQPMATGYFKVYSTPHTKFWCCTGTGMENFTKLGDAIYFVKENHIAVNMYLSSTIQLDGLTLMQESKVLEGGSTIVTVKEAVATGKEAVLHFRIPDWCAGKMQLSLNGMPYDYTEVDGYACVAHKFVKGDYIGVDIPMKITAHSLPDNKKAMGFKYGPLVLSAGLGHENMQTTTTGVAVTIPQDKIVESEYVILPNGITREEFINDLPLYFEQNGLAFALKGSNLIFTPHYAKYDERYGIYFYYLTEKEKLEAQVVQPTDKILDTVQPGYGQYENDELHNMQDRKQTIAFV